MVVYPRYFWRLVNVIVASSSMLSTYVSITAECEQLSMLSKCRT